MMVFHTMTLILAQNFTNIALVDNNCFNINCLIGMIFYVFEYLFVNVNVNVNKCELVKKDLNVNLNVNFIKFYILL